MQQYKICYKLFNEFCSKLYKRNYILSPTNTQKVQINNFIEKFEKQYGEAVGFDILFKYISFQFNYWSSLDYVKREGIEVNWIFGKKAVERWMKRQDSYYFFVERDFIKKYKINYFELRQLFEPKIKVESVLRDHEEKLKKKFYNTEEGLSYCLDHTTLYNEKSSLCLSCNNSKSCLSLLKIIYPKLYKRRTCEN